MLFKSLVTFFLFCCLNSAYPNFYSGNVIARDLKIPSVPWIEQIETIDPQQVNKLSETQLYNILDVYGYHFNDNSISNIFALIESNEINNDKKYMLFQRLLGEMKPQHIPKLIEYYHQLKSDKKISHFILSILETDYQLARRDNKNFENCEMLSSFFKSLKNSNFNSEDTSIIDRANHYLCK